MVNHSLSTNSPGFKPPIRVFVGRETTENTQTTAKNEGNPQENHWTHHKLLFFKRKHKKQTDKNQQHTQTSKPPSPKPPIFLLEGARAKKENNKHRGADVRLVFFVFLVWHFEVSQLAEPSFQGSRADFGARVRLSGPSGGPGGPGVASPECGGGVQGEVPEVPEAAPKEFLETSRKPKKT